MHQERLPIRRTQVEHVFFPALISRLLQVLLHCNSVTTVVEQFATIHSLWPA